MNEIWKNLIHPDISDSYEISNIGRIKIKCNNNILKHIYHSSNGYDYILLVLKDPAPLKSPTQYFPIDDLVALTFCICPDNLINIPVKVNHINGNLSDNYYENLEWVEDVEEWRDIIDDDVVPNMYQVSNKGHIRLKDTKILCNIHISNSRNGYPCVNLRRIAPVNDRHYKLQSVHKFVAKAFLNNTGECVNHIDGNKCNANSKNLEYCTFSDNSKHARMMGLSKGIPFEDINMIIELLQKYKKVSTVYQLIDHNKYPYITKNIVAFVKFKRYKFDNLNNIEFHKGSMTVDEMDMVRDKLIECNGDSLMAYNKIDHVNYPHITFQIVKEIKTGKYSTYNHSNKYDLSTLTFPKTIRYSKTLSISDIDNIRDILMENDGCVRITLENFKQINPNVTENMIYDIKRGKSYKYSKKYDMTNPRYPWNLLEV